MVMVIRHFATLASTILPFLTSITLALHISFVPRVFSNTYILSFLTLSARYFPLISSFSLISYLRSITFIYIDCYLKPLL